MNSILSGINGPEDVRSLSKEQLDILAQEIREELVNTTAKTGGHLASSLGAVELILALHSIYDFSHDHLVFDVGHQAYAHKLITGRRSDFDTLRCYGGICGFTKRAESPYDSHDAGHASDSLSIALGLAMARDLDGRTENVVTLIGDASISGGMAFEALNHIGHLNTNLTIILNDNEMSISRNVGALSLYLAKARLSKPYISARDGVEGKLGELGRVGRFLVDAGEAFKGSFKKLVVPGMFFEDMGIKYIGPIDGHNITALQEALIAAKKTRGPVLIHAVTTKGRGFSYAEERPDIFHGVGAYDPETGEPVSAATGQPKYTEVFSQAMVTEGGNNPDIIAITAAMQDGTGLSAFKKHYPNRFFDVGIAEEHAVTFAAGLALGGKLPVVAIYSTFLQRAYDQMIVNVALQKQHVVFCIDRAGLVGEDGPTHHGVFDLVYLRSIPQMRILAPADGNQLIDALHTALALDNGPIALRYPRGSIVRELEQRPPRLLQEGKAAKIREGKDVALLAVGRMVRIANEVANILAEEGIEAAVYNMLWVKPLDEDAILEASTTKLVITLEEGTVNGGFGSGVLEVLAKRLLDGQCHATRTLVLGLPDEFITHGDVAHLVKDLGLSAPQVAQTIKNKLYGQDAAR